MRAVLLLPVLVSIAACGSQSPSEPPSDPSVGRVVLARVGSDARPAEVRPERNATPRKLATLTRNAISAGEPFLVDVPPTADRLAFSLACAHGPEEPRCPPFRIEGSDAEGGFRQLFQESGDVGWQDREIALDPAPERLRFSLAEGDVDGDPLWGSVLLLAPEPRLRPNVVLISMDTLGADSLEPPDGPPGVSPILGALRVRGADFRRAYAQYGNTLVSHASLFSGLYPRSHGLYSGNQPQLLTSSLVSVLADAGYRTVAFTEGAFVSAAFGFSVGFDAYDDGKLFLARQVEGGAPQTFEQAGKWIVEIGRHDRFFAFIHTYEVHQPYLPRDEAALRIAAEASPGDERMFTAEQQGLMSLTHNRGKPLMSQRDLDRLEALHLGEVHTLDFIIGRFLERIAETALERDTLVVITADHGDQFGEAGKVAHGDSLHDRVIHVPLVLLWPSHIQPRRIEDPVQLVDVLPTLIELVGLAVPDALDGRSLAPYLRGEPIAERPAFAEQRTARGECARLGLELGCRLDRISVHDGRWKLVSSRLPPWRRLFDLEADPREERDVAHLHPEVADRLEALVEVYRRTGLRNVPPTLEGVDADTLQRLRDLGYIDEAEAGDETSPPLPDAF